MCGEFLIAADWKKKQNKTKQNKRQKKSVMYSTKIEWSVASALEQMFWNQ